MGRHLKTCSCESCKEKNSQEIMKEQIETFKVEAPKENKEFNLLAKELESKFNAKRASEIVIEPKIRTDVYGFDYVLDGGIAQCEGGHKLELFGRESSGKTTLAMKIVAKFQKLNKKCLWVNAENSYDPEWAEILGVQNNKLIVVKPDTLEDAGDLIISLIPKVDLIIIDSIIALTPAEELEGGLEDKHMCSQAKINAPMCRKINQAYKNYKTTIVFINQIREKVGIMYGNPETTSGGRCVSKDTRILTTNGIKTYKEIKIGDIIPTVNIKTKEVEYQPIEDIIIEKSEKIYEIFSEYYSYRFAPNHRILTYKFKNGQCGNDLQFIYPQEDFNRINIPIAFETKSQCVCNKCNSQINKYPIEDSMLKVIAWIITDGSIKRNNNINMITIYQSKYPDRVRAVLEEAKLKFKETIRPPRENKKIKGKRDAHVFYLYNAKNIIENYNLNNFLKHRFPNWLQELSTEQFKIFLEEMMLGDGHMRNEKLKAYICDAHKEFIEDLAILCVTHGVPISKIKKDTKNCWYLYFRQCSHIQLDQKKLLDYNDIVWCPTVKNGTFFAEREGSICVTGNSLKHLYDSRIEVRAGAPIEINKEKIGFEMNLKCVKNKKGKPQHHTVIDFYFTGNFDQKKSILFAGVKYGVIKFSGKTYEYKDLKAVGKDAFMELMTDKIMKEIENDIWKVAK